MKKFLGALALLLLFASCGTPVRAPISLLTVDGPNQVSVAVTGAAVERVDASLDGTEFGTDTTEPYEFLIQKDALAEGAHELVLDIVRSGPDDQHRVGFWVGAVTDPPPTNLVLPVRRYFYHYSLGSTEIDSVREMQFAPHQFRAGLDLARLVTEHDRDLFVDDAGPFEGWHVLLNRKWLNDARRLQNNNYNGLTLDLRRAAVVGVVYHNNTIPEWLAEWDDAGAVIIQGSTRIVRTRTLPAGVTRLGDVITGHVPYDVIIMPDQVPSVAPAGMEQPAPNEVCPAWVHDEYGGHHPQIDPVYWCGFTHEHGSDPQLFGDGGIDPGVLWPETEPHHGHKLFLLRGDGTDLLLSVHWATGLTLDRVCVRYHSMQLLAWSGGQLVAHLRWDADTGFPRATLNNNVNVPFGAAQCPGDPTAVVWDTSTTGRRNIPSPVPGDTQTGYETVQVDWAAAAALPIVGSFVMAFDNPQARCDARIQADGSVLCAGPLFWSATQDGTMRWGIIVNNEAFGVTNYGGPAVFCTDARAAVVVGCGSPGSVQQFVLPGTTAIIDAGGGKFQVRDAWTAEYLLLGNDVIRVDRNIEDSVPVPGSN